jgi:hypothetical protein
MRIGSLRPNGSDLLWAGEPPRTATNTLQTLVLRLRRALRASEAGDDERGQLRTTPSGYLLEVDPDALDASRFESLLGEARRAFALERHAVALEMLRHALALWRGPALVEFASEPSERGPLAWGLDPSGEIRDAWGAEDTPRRAGSLRRPSARSSSSSAANSPTPPSAGHR